VSDFPDSRVKCGRTTERRVQGVREERRIVDLDMGVAGLQGGKVLKRKGVSKRVCVCVCVCGKVKAIERIMLNDYLSSLMSNSATGGGAAEMPRR